MYCACDPIFKYCLSTTTRRVATRRLLVDYNSGVSSDVMGDAVDYGITSTARGTKTKMNENEVTYEKPPYPNRR